MRKLKGLGFLLILSAGWTTSPLTAGDVVLNHGFETEDTVYWIEIGNVPIYHKGVVKFDTTGNGKTSWAFYQHPGDGCSGGLQQTIHVLQGVTYQVAADVCYHSG